MRRRTPTISAATAAATALLTVVSCSSATEPPKAAQTGTLAPVASTSTTTTTFAITEGSTPGTARGTTPGTVPGTTPGSTPGTAVPAGACPDRTEVTVRTRAGDKAVRGGTAWADVTLDASAQIIITNYETPSTVADGIWQPSMTGDQVGILLYVTSVGGTLQTSEYLPVGSNPSAKLQLNSVQAYSAAGREILGGFAGDEGVRLTKIDEKVVCGTFDLAEGSGTFVATRT